MKEQTKAQLQGKLDDLTVERDDLRAAFEESEKTRIRKSEEVEILEAKCDRLVIALKEINAANRQLLELL